MTFAIHDLDSGDHVGVVNVHSIDLLNRSAGVGIHLESIARGKGYATDALRVGCAYVFDHLGLHRFTYGAFATNAASIKLARRCGFVEEGRRRKGKLTRHGWVDRVAFAMLADEWAALKKGAGDATRSS